MHIYIPLLTMSIAISLILLIVIAKSKSKNQIKKIFEIDIGLVITLTLSVLLQLLLAEKLNIEPVKFEYFSYIGGCFLPVSVFFTGLVFANTKIEFKNKYLLLFIIPIISLLVLWTNDYHHLFYEVYSTSISETVYGPYMTIHNIYSYTLLIIGIIYLLKFSIKNSGFFSKQSIFIVLGISAPVLVNILGTFKIIPMSVYITPISFTVTIVFFAISIFKFQFLGVAPIALQKIVDRMSDSYIVISDYGEIVDFNKTFINTFKLEGEKIRGKDFFEFLCEEKRKIKSIDKIEEALKISQKTNQMMSFEYNFDNINKYFKIEITPISTKDTSLGNLILLKDITQHVLDMETIKRNQDILMERERLASLGQLIGGIAHNLRSPIMSIAGATEGLEELIKEYDESIDDPLVDSHDHHEIAAEMQSWIPKIRTYTEYMSDIITTVKGQAVALTNEQDVAFTVSELVKRVNILMKHELKNAYINFKVIMKTDENLTLIGDVNNLVQVVDNMISNSIQAYDGARNKDIELEINKDEKNVIITIKDSAGGLPKEVQEKLFKEMVTTKGKNGTGLGLYMSYSNIKAHFGGDITYKTEQGKGTEFNIIIPMKK